MLPPAGNRIGVLKPLLSRTSFIAIRLIIALSVLFILFVSQRYWFRRALEFHGRFDSPRVKIALRILLTLACAIVVISLVDHLFVHFLPHQGPATWIVAIAQLWLFSSFFAFLGKIGRASCRER